MAGETLYTPEVLAAAVGLAAFPLDAALPLRGEARSRSCGSTLELSLATDAAGKIVSLGCTARACAVGQAAAAIFLNAAVGRDRSDIAAARQSIAAWLADTAACVPDWPGLGLIGPARRYPARHGAVLLAWDAALEALANPLLVQQAANR